jgi:hypothetical protein
MDIGQHYAVESDPEVSYGPQNDNICDYTRILPFHKNPGLVSGFPRCSGML